MNKTVEDRKQELCYKILAILKNTNNELERLRQRHENAKQR